jgi:hypothetical protein
MNGKYIDGGGWLAENDSQAGTGEQILKLPRLKYHSKAILAGDLDESNRKNRLDAGRWITVRCLVCSRDERVLLGAELA